MFSSNTSQVSGAATDPDFEYVTMLLHGDGTNGGQNNTFVDSSTNNFSITRNGNATQGSFSPYGTLWSNYFGSGNSIYISTSSVFAFSGDFTVEAWVFVNNTSTSGGFDPRLINIGGGIDILFVDSSKAVQVKNSSTTVVTSSSNAIALNTWQHVAIVRSGSTVTIYVNGTSVGSASYSSTFSDVGDARIARLEGSGSGYLDGYISNLRIVKGSAVYTGSFTPSTTPLTAITNTVLLTCQSNRFIDNSSNNFTLTVSGSPSVQRFSPFAPSAAYSTATIGGSGYFDGSGDYLDVNSTSTFDFGTGDLTIEFWAKPNAATNYQGVVCVTYNGGNPNNGYLIVELSPARGLFVNADAFSTEVSSTAAYPAYENAWHHWAVTRASGTWKIFKDGVSQTLATNTIGSANFTGTTGVIVGAQVGSGSSPAYYPFNGNLSDVRIVKGTAVYTSNFTPPTAPLTAITNTQLLTNFTNGAIFDNAMMNDLETVGNAQISTSVVKYGTGSLAFDGTGDYLAVPYSPNVKLPSGDWTIEFWMYCTGAQSGSANAVWIQDDTGGYSGILVSANSSRQVQFTSSTSGSSWNYLFQTIGTYTDNTWAHVAICKSGSTVYGFFNGSLNLTINSFPATIYSTTNQSTLGTYSTSYFNGYIDDFRITKGYARYTANFTPPTQAFPNN